MANKGFGLMEIVIALFLLAFVILASLNGVMHAMQQSQEVRALSQTQYQTENDYERQLANKNS